jgi:hypothetical protein
VIYTLDGNDDAGGGLDATTIVAVTPAPRPHRTHRWSSTAVWGLVALTVLGLAVVAWFDHLLRQAGRPDLSALGSDDYGYVLLVVSAVAVGALLAIRRPRHPVGWLLLILGLSVLEAGVSTGYEGYGLLVRAEPLWATDYAAWSSDAGFLVWPALLGFLMLLTPTGTLPSRRWRWWARVAAAAPVVWLVGAALQTRPLDPPFQAVTSPLAVPALDGPAQYASWLALLVVGVALLVGAASLIVRFRRARGVERQQLRWVAFAAALSVVGVLVIGVLEPLLPGGNELLLSVLTAACLSLLPLSTGAAILRYRLYDLDRIIGRTLAYGLLTVLLGGGYAGVVLGLGQLLGRDSPLVVAGATLTVAAVFQPARKRIQRAMDRRFDRRRYDAAHTIQAFSARLRQQVDLDTLTAELLTVVEQTMQPTRVSLWLRPSPHDSLGTPRSEAPPTTWAY